MHCLMCSHFDVFGFWKNRELSVVEQNIFAHFLLMINELIRAYFPPGSYPCRYFACQSRILNVCLLSLRSRYTSFRTEHSGLPVLRCLYFLCFAKESNKERRFLAKGSAGQKIALRCCCGEYYLAPQYMRPDWAEEQ